jgi:hypothetical protein
MRLDGAGGGCVDRFEQFEELGLDRFSRLHASAPHQID